MKARISLALVAFFVIFLIVMPFATALAADTGGQALYSDASKYEGSEDYQKAKDTYTQFVQQFPSDPCASEARINIAKMDILLAIKMGKADKDVQPMIDTFTADFSANPLLCKALLSIALRFENSGNFAKARGLYEYVTTSYPACSYYDSARVNAAKAGIITLIDSGADAQSAIDRLAADFGQNPGLPKALYDIAERYERKKIFDKAVAAYQQLIQKCPNSPCAADAQLDVQKITILSLIESGNAPQAQIDKLQSDFKTHPALPFALYRIAEGYERAKNPVFDEKARVIYQKVAQTYPGNPYAVRAQLDAAKIGVLQAITSGADAKGSVDQLINNFSSHPRLPGALYVVAVRYTDIQKFDKARDIYRIISERFPQSSYSERALIYGAEANTLFLIQSGSLDDAKIAADKLIADFSGNANLPQVICHIAERYQEAPKPDYAKAALFYQKVITDYPSNKYAPRAQVYSAAANTMAMIDSLADAEPNGTGGGQQAAMDRINASLADIKAAYAANPELCRAMLAVAERCYEEGLNSSYDPNRNKFFLWKAVELLDGMAKQDISDSMLKASVFYVKGLNYWQLGEYFDAGDAFSASIEANPNHEFAGNMHWLVADSYEKLKAAGDVNAPDADAVIEWGYQTLFDNYPDCSIIDYAAVRLSQINMEQGKQTAACAYYCWLVMNADGDEGRMDFINNMFKRCGRCGNE
jgi:TolA-binding protein